MKQTKLKIHLIEKCVHFKKNYMQNIYKIDKDILFKRRTKVQLQVKISQKLHTEKKNKNIFLIFFKFNL